MKKIGLVTIIDYQNYGNRLQNYAAQEVLKKLNFEVTTILNVQETVNISENAKLSYLQKIKMTNISKIKKKIISLFNRSKREEAMNKKIQNFKKFSDQYINESDFIISSNSIPDNLNNKFDYFIVGSDQVWNPHYRFGSEIDFLTFADKKKRVSYAASFGVSEIPGKFIKNYSKWLNDMESLSVREDAGASIIKDLTGKDIPVLVDPTLMLDAEEWLTISKISDIKPQKNFILTYVLGEKTKELKKFIKNISKENNLEVINIADFDNLKYYDLDPSEFIDLISTCSLVITDSFHGTVFSLLFNKPFIVYNRVDSDVKMNSRINTLLSKFALENRTWNSIDKSNVFDVDFSDIPRRLEIERNISLEYLRESLKIK